MVMPALGTDREYPITYKHEMKRYENRKKIYIQKKMREDLVIQLNRLIVDLSL